jgi:hypothetical protein
MDKYFIKYQWFYILVALIFVVGNLNLFYEFKLLEKKTKPFMITVIDKHCSGKNGAYLKVDYKNKMYSINTTYTECCAYYIGNDVLVYYSTRFDYFVLPKMKFMYILRLKIISTILFLLLLPWNYLISRTKTIFTQHHR